MNLLFYGCSSKTVSQVTCQFMLIRLISSFFFSSYFDKSIPIICTLDFLQIIRKQIQKMFCVSFFSDFPNTLVPHFMTFSRYKRPLLCFIISLKRLFQNTFPTYFTTFTNKGSQVSIKDAES